MTFHSGPHNGTDQLVAMVSEVKFQQTKFRVGYYQSDVDDYLDHLIDVIKDGKRGDDITQLVDGALFHQSKFGLGYEQDEVDDFLEDIKVACGGTRHDEVQNGIVEYPKRSLLKRMFGRD